ncbi:MAG: response regulator [Candidatus Omnitrophica bacterium]|nr:response regulator [Candidatus Omnitrophota bacterium]
MAKPTKDGLNKPAEGSSKSPAAKSSEGKGTLIYVIDDELSVGEAIKMVLESEGYRTRFFVDPALALSKFKAAEPRPRLLVTDYVMTPINGMELIDRCLKIDSTLKTILISGSVSSEIASLYQAKPSFFLSKPFSPNELSSAVAALLKAK